MGEYGMNPPDLSCRHGDAPPLGDAAREPRSLSKAGGDRRARVAPFVSARREETMGETRWWNAGGLAADDCPACSSWTLCEWGVCWALAPFSRCCEEAESEPRGVVAGELLVGLGPFLDLVRAHSFAAAVARKEPSPDMLRSATRSPVPKSQPTPLSKIEDLRTFPRLGHVQVELVIFEPRLPENGQATSSIWSRPKGSGQI